MLLVRCVFGASRLNAHAQPHVGLSVAIRTTSERMRACNPTAAEFRKAPEIVGAYGSREDR